MRTAVLYVVLEVPLLPLARCCCGPVPRRPCLRRCLLLSCLSLRGPGILAETSGEVVNFYEVVRELEESGLRLGTSVLRVPALWQLRSCSILLNRRSDFSCTVQAGRRGAAGCLSAMVLLTVMAFRLPSGFCAGEYSQGVSDASAFANESIPTDTVFLSSRFSSRSCI